MNKTLRSVLALALSLLLLGSFPLSVFAEPEEEAVQAVTITRITLSNEAEFLTFAENCRLDSYSQNLEVTLKANLDLTGLPFEGIPIFCGTFLGGGHKITGFAIDRAGSDLGFFRYVTDTAQVKNLHLSGAVSAQGSGMNVGGFAGVNAGRIEGCSFSGTVAGGDGIGGLVGINQVTGIVDDSCTLGQITGNHYIGGICGENLGVIRNCVNNSKVNTTPQQNSVDITGITLENITGTENVITVTDIGGIAGISSGVIRSCDNRGAVGYQQMSYNVGGIVGSQTGYVVSCRNYGAVNGRKEVGGIAGQMEPATTIEYSIDTLQILKEQMNDLSGVAGRATSNAQSGAAQITGQITVLEDYMESARDAVDTLIPDEENPELPDIDTILAAQNTLSTSVQGMNTTIDGIVSALEGTVKTLSRDMQAVSAQIGAMGKTLNNADENLGGAFADVSDEDTPEQTGGKMEACCNYGSVLADMNVGGITGAMAFENDLDPEDDLQIAGDASLNYEGKIRCVVLSCENEGLVTANKQRGGGIVGWQSMGLVRACRNTGSVEAAAADYVGGIAGQSTGYIRSSSVRCALLGNACVGGIAGSASVVTDCQSVARIESGTEKLGGVLGIEEEAYADEENPIAGNVYLCLGTDFGGIDGISYAGKAEPMEQNAFLGQTELPEYFKKVNVAFIQEDGTVHTVQLESGGKLPANLVPAVPEKAGFVGTWDGMAEADLQNITFDLTFTAAYTPICTTLESEEIRMDKVPLVLVQGLFITEGPVNLEQTDAAGAVEAWTVTLPADAALEKVRFALPDGYGAEDVLLQVYDSETGTYTGQEFTESGSYIVFATRENQTRFRILQVEKDYSLYYYAAAGAAALVLLIVITAAVRRKKKKKKHRPEESKE